MDLHPPSGLQDHPVEMTSQFEQEESRTDENTAEEGKEEAIEILAVGDGGIGRGAGTLCGIQDSTT